MLTETDVIEKLSEYFIQLDYQIIQKLTLRQKGIDIIAKDVEGTFIYIEAKGETSGTKNTKRFGRPFNGNQIWSHVSVALLKSLTTINEQYGKEIRAGMAFPENHRHLLERIKPSLEKLELTVYLVSESGVSIL
ncbi:hypothetical protein [Rurimicrobium arvi]|uniref:Uncharacterized protein n=1 Tax=Rurimicrobium arvi TaxID=2049916 RepID=A0ABP8MX66_9BACT